MYRTRTPFLVWVSLSLSFSLSLSSFCLHFFFSISFFLFLSLSRYVSTYIIHYIYWNCWHHSDESLYYCQICIFIHLLYLNVLYRAKTRMITGHKGAHGSFRGVWPRRKCLGNNNERILWDCKFAGAECNGLPTWKHGHESWLSNHRRDVAGTPHTSASLSLRLSAKHRRWGRPDGLVGRWGLLGLATHFFASPSSLPPCGVEEALRTVSTVPDRLPIQSQIGQTVC